MALHHHGERESDARAGRKPTAAPATAGHRAARHVTAGVAQVRPNPWYGLELVPEGHVPELPELPLHTAAGVLDEQHRHCANPACGKPVGRGHEGEPGRVEGVCPHCGTPFDFSRPLGRTVAGRYELEHVLGSGAYGAAYLARDRNLDTHVVLKHLNQSVAQTALDERNALVGLRHDSIVRILGYEPEGPHLVLEYVPGAPLAARDDDPLETLLAHGIRVLQALDYLHARGLLHCDVKPLNIIRFREEGATGPLDRVRLIDFGSVRSRKDTGPVVAYTKPYAPPQEDREHAEPTAGFDLFGLGRTLLEVCSAHLKNRTAPGVHSLELLLQRATDVTQPERRFVSARQFGEQLSGVVRQLVAASPTGRQVARPSALFGSMPEPLHGGLGVARPLGDWVRAVPDEDGLLTLPEPFSAPRLGEIAVALPTPLADPDDPYIGESAGNALAESRLALRRKDVALAARALERSGLEPWHWLHAWYSGLIALAREDAGLASHHFGEVRQTVPGELIPQLALGLCAECDGDHGLALAHYATVFATAPALGAAGFGLARVLLPTGRREDAVAAMERLAQEFGHEREARIAAVRLLGTVLVPPARATSRTLAAPPTEDDLTQARETLAGLDLDDAAAAGLRAEIQYAEFLRTRDRLALSEAVRQLGAYAPTEREYVALVDLANRLRPPPERRWLRRLGRTGRARFRGTPDTLSS
ncbi:tetratricopeptide repeat protein [Streptomyces sp. NPDC001658]